MPYVEVYEIVVVDVTQLSVHLLDIGELSRQRGARVAQQRLVLIVPARPEFLDALSELSACFLTTIA